MMENKITKKLLAIMMIITLLATDFFVLGSSLITYATQVTNEIKGYPNIHFSTYFKEGENEVKQINKSVKDKELKLYAKIGVNSDVDCLEDIQIKLKDDNFNIISSNKGTVEENTVKLDYIAAGSLVEIELKIEPKTCSKISSDMLVKANTELEAKYKYADAPEGKNIKATSESIVKYEPDEATKADLETDIITNKVLAVNGVNKRVIQLLVKSRLTNNEFPVKQTTLNVSIPKLEENAPEVSTLVVGKLATNGTTEISNIKTENGNTQITLNNEIDANNQVSWTKNAYDEIVVTYIYSEIVDASIVEITTNSEIKLHGSGNTYAARYTKGIKNQELNNVVMNRTEITTEELYKGQLYANIDTEYNTKTSIIITNANVENEVAVHEGPDTFGTAESELPANTKYITTKINLEKMLSILGQDGTMTIKNGETTTIINKDTIVDADGNVVINHENSTSELDITTSKPLNAGVLEINHIKAIAKNTYTREEIKTIKTLKSIGSNKSTIELKETVSKAELTIDRTALSATEANEVTVGIKLITNGAKYDLYKNPSIAIKFPETVENVEFIDEPSKIYADEFTITNKSYNKANHTMTINMAGEQTKYPESSLTQSYIQLKLKVTLSQFVMSQTDKITMTYTNGEKTGVIEQPIEISAPNELIKMFNISLNTNTSRTENILQQVRTEDSGKEFNFDIELVNNKDTDMSNVKILGKLPTTGNTISGEVNTLETTLKNVIAQNAKIYYTENSNATEDIENSENGWTQNLEQLTNAKLYLIKLDNLARGAKFTATLAEQMSNPITENALSYAQYKVIYDTTTETEVKEESRKIGFISSAVASIKVETTAQVGENSLKSGDIVKEGEVIKYRITVRNNGIETLQNVKLKLAIPEGTVLVTPIEKYIFAEGTDEETVIENGGYVYAEGSYYEEITDNEKLDKLTNITIPELSTTPYMIEYEVRVNKGTAGSEISNKSVVIFKESTVEAEEIKNTIEEANIRVTIKRAIDISEQLYANGYAEYIVYVENLSNKKLKNLEMQVNAKGLKIDSIEEMSENTFKVNGHINKDAKEISISAIVKDSEGKEYRSNRVTESLPYVNATINMTSPQEGGYIKEGDNVEYNITVKNTGDIESIIQVTDNIPEPLTVNAIYVNNELKTEGTKISNNIDYSIVLKPGEQAEIKIVANAGNISESFNGKTVSNSVTMNVQGVLEAKTETIINVLRTSSSQDENIENIISGYVWLDKNADGKRNSDEENLSEVSLKIYDISSKHYVTDEHGNPIEVVTGDNGEYIFTKIPSGSYLIIAKYNNKKYEFAINDLNTSVFNANIGLSEKIESKPVEEQPENPDNPNDSSNTETPSKPDDSGNEETTLKTVSGLAWLDSNRNGQKDESEPLLSGIKVRIYDIKAQKYLAETTTNENGKYEFANIEKGSYILTFEYDKDKYEPTAYMAEGIATELNSKAIINKVTINGQEMTVAVTDTINVQNNVANINIGLKENLKFDLELNKYISKIVVNTNQKTKQYDYENATFEKIEIHRKQIQGANVVLEYTIKVKNTGEIAGYASNIIDYLPSGLTFSSELNKDWYLSGNYLHTKSLENVELKPGEEKEVKLVLTKTMTGDNVGLINNRAEIYKDYNRYGESDIDSTPNNQAPNEDDLGSVDVIIQIATGGSDTLYTILLIINILLLGFAIKLMIRNRMIRLPSRKWRR